MNIPHRKFRNGLNSNISNDDFYRCIEKIKNEIYNELSKYKEFDFVRRITIKDDGFDYWIDSEDFGSYEDEGCEIEIIVEIGSNPNNEYEYGYEKEDEFDFNLLSEIISRTIKRSTRNSAFVFTEEDSLDDGDQIFFYYTVKVK